MGESRAVVGEILVVRFVSICLRDWRCTGLYSFPLKRRDGLGNAVLEQNKVKMYTGIGNSDSKTTSTRVAKGV